MHATVRSLLNNTPLLLLGGFALFAALAYLGSQQANDRPAPEWTAVEQVAASTPSADNVDPGFHARLMTLRDRLARSPEDTSALLEAARLEQDAHQLARSADHYERFLALAPQRHQPWLDLANVYAGLGQWDDARRASERMLGLYPGDASALYNLGAIAANRGKHDEAQRHWRAVLNGPDAALAAQAQASLAQLDALAAAPPAARSQRRPAPNPHASLSQPVMAHRTSRPDRN